MSFKLNKSEFDHFSDLASEWWLKNGKFKILHDIQSVRISFIQNVFNKKKLKNVSVLDLGCGGGLISEELAKLGADVTGLDFVKQNIEVAKEHAYKNKLKINYKTLNFENEKIESKFDMIIILEVLEHLSNWKYFIEKIRTNLKPNGKVIISTINRNLLSKFLTIDLAEIYLRWIPINTHKYYKFIKPKELEYILIKNTFKNIIFKGIKYNPLEKKWHLSKSLNVNYFCSCEIN